MIQNCAMIDQATMRVVNVIVADPENDNPWPGHIMVALNEGQNVDMRWGWNEDTGLYPADPDLVAELVRQREEIARLAAMQPYLLDD